MDDDTGTHPDDDHESHGTDGHGDHSTAGHGDHDSDAPETRGNHPSQARAAAGPAHTDTGTEPGPARGTQASAGHAPGDNPARSTAHPPAAEADTGSPGPAPGTRPKPTATQTPHRLTLWEQRTEILLAVASMAFLVAYALRVLVPGLPQAALDLCLAVTLAAWALFAVDYAVRWRLSGQGRRFVRRHVLDTVVLILPLLRPLRIVKVYETVQRRHGQPRLPLHGRVMAYSGLSTLLLGFTGALAVFQQERDAPGTTMPTFGDAVWWTCATLTTVGYGDVVPVTPLGRLIAVGVMMIGLALLAAVTGTFASWLLQVFAREDDERPPGS